MASCGCGSCVDLATSTRPASLHSRVPQTPWSVPPPPRAPSFVPVKSKHRAGLPVLGGTWSSWSCGQVRHVHSVALTVHISTHNHVAATCMCTLTHTPCSPSTPGAVSCTPSVKRVVLTSSCAAIYGDPHEFGKDHVYTEADWNPTASETVLPYYYRCGAAARGSGPGPADAGPGEIVAKLCRYTVS